MIVGKSFEFLCHGIDQMEELKENLFFTEGTYI